MKKNTFLLIILFPAMMYAQKKNGYSRLYPSYSVQNYFDHKSVKYHDIVPPDYLQPKNTTGHSLGLQYERVTRYGLILSGGLGYGVRRYDVTIYQDGSDFDPVAVNYLKGQIFRNTTKLAINYWSYNLMAGYRKQLPNRMAAVAKGGFALKKFYDGEWGETKYNINYFDDSGLVLYEVQFADIEKRFGRDTSITPKGFLGRNRFPQGIFTFEFYLGIEKDINKPFIKNISIGFEGCRNWWRWNGDGIMTVRASRSVNQLGSGRANFYDRNLSIGLRIGLGLWK